MAKRKHQTSGNEPPNIGAKKIKCDSDAKKVKNDIASKKVINDDEQDLSTVKCALRKRCKNEEVYNAIQEDVTMISSLAVEASRYIHFMLSAYFSNDIFDINTIFPPSAKRVRRAQQLQRQVEEKIDFGYYFYALLPKYADQLHPVYREMRGNLPLYDISHRSNLMIDVIKQFKTSIRNNIVVHAWTRIKKFFLHFGYENENGEFVKFKYADIRSTLFYLFYRETDEVPREDLLQSLEQDLQWNRNERLFDIDIGDNYFKHIALFYRLQRFNENNRYKNFKLIPLFHFGSLHIQYDTQAMFALLKKLNLLKPPDVPEEKRKKKNWWRDHIQQNEVEKRKMWLDFFKPPETYKKKFNFSLRTDGVAVSFSMRKPADKTSQWSNNGEAYGTYTYFPFF